MACAGSIPEGLPPPNEMVGTREEWEEEGSSSGSASDVWVLGWEEELVVVVVVSTPHGLECVASDVEAREEEEEEEELSLSPRAPPAGVRRVE